MTLARIRGRLKPKVVASAVNNVLFSDNFESGDLSKTENGFSWQAPNFGSGDALGVSSDNPLSGSNSLRFFFEGQADLAADAFSEQRLTLGANYIDATVTFDLYIPPNYNHRDATGADNNKFMAVYRDPYGSPGFQINFSTSRQANGNSSLSCHIYNNGSEISPVNPAEGIDFIDASEGGTWVNYEMRIAVPTSSTSNDGILQVWKNGEVQCNLTNVSSYGGDGENYFNELYLLGAANSGYTQDTIFFLDDFVIKDGVTV